MIKIEIKKLIEKFSDSSKPINTDSITNAFLSLQRVYYSGQKVLDDSDLNLLEDCFYLILTRNLQSQLIDVLVFLADVAKFNNRSDIVNNLLEYLPQNSAKLRLEAFVKYRRVDNIKTDILSNAEIVFKLINEADRLNSDDISDDLINDLLQFYEWGKNKLEKRGYLNELKLFKDKFIYADKRLFPLLNAPFLLRGLDGSDTINIILELQSQNTSVYQPSDMMDAFFEKNIIQPLRIQPLTNFPNTIIGYEKNEIRRDILEYGLTDFDKSFQGVNSSQKVLLYNYFNLRKHFFTLYHIFKKIQFQQIVLDKNLVVIDLGCGPGTASLVIADFIKSTNKATSCNYIGIDISNAMIESASKHIENIKSLGINFEYTFEKELNNNSIDYLVNNSSIMIFVASYLFASNSLDEIKLGEVVNDIINRFKNTPVMFIYQNPDEEQKNKKYFNFKRTLKDLNSVMSQNESIFYKTKRKSTFEPSSEFFYFEILGNSKVKLN